MIDLLERAAATAPTQPAVVTADGSWTYADVANTARRIAAGLDRLAVEQFAVAEPDAPRVLALLAGAALAGAEPCQFQPDLDATDLVAQATAFGHRVIVTRRRDLGDGLRVIDPDSLVDDPPSGASAPESMPIVIRTTGTTGVPKSARHDWTVLGRTVADFPPRTDRRWLLAYGLHQFAGVQVLQHVVATSGTLIAPFPRQPRDGLDAAVRDGVTCISATPTYWRFFLAEARSRGAALPALEQVTLGGEACPPDLLDDLRATFPAANISQIYASTEFGSIASVRDGRPGLMLESCFGDENPDATIRVIDGELWVRSGAGMVEYAGEDPVDSAATSEGLDGWRPTGDLVEIVGDRVLFRGRTSEVINVGGVKVHPLPVENRILALDGVDAARVFGRANRLTGAIVATEIVAADASDASQEAIRRAIKQAMSDLPPAWHPRSISFVEAIVTQGEKTVRKIEP